VEVTLTPAQQATLLRYAAHNALHSPQEALDHLLSTTDTNTPRSSRRPWEPQELALLRNPRNHPRDIARATGRTPSAVSNRRHQLAREENLPALRRPPPTPPPAPDTPEQEI
jgi:hypothetical protein